MYADDLVRAGVPVAEARRRAGVEFGGIGARKEDIREALGLRLLDEVPAISATHSGSCGERQRSPPWPWFRSRSVSGRTRRSSA